MTANDTRGYFLRKNQETARLDSNTDKEMAAVLSH